MKLPGRAWGEGVQKGVLTKEAEAAVTILFATLRGKCHMACVCECPTPKSNNFTKNVSSCPQGRQGGGKGSVCGGPAQGLTGRWR